MYTLLVMTHVFVGLVLILVVLLQSGKAGDLAGAFGGTGSQTAFGTRSAATLLTKATTVCAVVFMLTSLSLAILSMRTTGTVMEDVPLEEGVPAATQPAPTPQPAAPPATEPPASPPPDQPGENQ